MKLNPQLSLSFNGQCEEAFRRYGYSEDVVTRRRLNPQMYNSFRDGSKAQIEMTSLARIGTCFCSQGKGPRFTSLIATAWDTSATTVIRSCKRSV